MEKNETCDYCRDFYDDPMHKDLINKNVEIGSGVFALEVGVDASEKCLWAGMTEWIEGKTNINYCPMCGRKL